MIFVGGDSNLSCLIAGRQACAGDSACEGRVFSLLSMVAAQRCRSIAHLSCDLPALVDVGVNAGVVRAGADGVLGCGVHDDDVRV